MIAQEEPRNPSTRHQNRNTLSARAPSIRIAERQDEIVLYCKLRARVYARDLGLSDFPDEPNTFDRKSDIILAQRDGTLIGGVRMTMRAPGQTHRLPFEEGGLGLSELMPDRGLEGAFVGELSGLAIAPNERLLCTESLLRFCIERAKGQGAQALCAIAPRVQVRRYRRLERRLGFRMDIAHRAPLPPASIRWGLKMQLLLFTAP